jgi:hypothetical protein
MQEPIDVAEQEEQEAQDRERAKLIAQLVAADFKWLLSSKRGRRIVWRLLEDAGVFRSSFTNDPHVTSFNEGRRQYGLKVLAMIHEHSPETYPTMLTEQKDYERHNSNTSSNGSNGTSNN